MGRRAGAAAASAAVLVAALAACGAEPCSVTRWGEWSACSKPCGLGEKSRQRSVIARGDEGSCPALREFTYCNEQPCPVDCVLSAWSPYGACSVHCGGGTQQRQRRVTRPAEFGGKCPHLSETRACSTQSCGHYEHGVVALPGWPRRVKCARVDFGDAFTATPRVIVTPVRTSANASAPPHVAASAWVESANTRGMRVCADGRLRAGASLQVHWLAADHDAALFTFMCSQKLVRTSVAVVESLSAAAGGGGASAPTCTDVRLAEALPAGTAQLALTASRPAPSVADARAGTVGLRAWAESVRLDGFRACVQPAAVDGVPAQAVDAPVQLSYAVFSGLGTPDPRRDAPCAASTVRSGSEKVPSWSGGVKCHLVQLDPPLPAAPRRVLASAARASAPDFFPSSVVTAWVETAERDTIRVCLHETDGPSARKGLYVNWIAFTD